MASPVNSAQAYKRAKTQADQGTSFAQTLLDEVSGKHLPYDPCGCTAQSVTSTEWIKNRHKWPANNKFIPASHPTFTVMPALRLLDVVIGRIKESIFSLSKLVQDLITSNTWLNNRVREISTEQEVLKTSLTATSTRVDAVARRLDTIQTQNPENLPLRVQAFEEQNEQLRQEIARKDEEHERRLAEVEQRHAAQIRALQLAVSHLSSHMDGTSTAANSLRSLSDDEFVSPYNSDDDL